MDDYVNLTIPLFNNENLLDPSFIKSKRWIINNFQTDILQSSNKSLCFENIYREKFKAELVPGFPKSWEQLKFKNLKDKSVFLLTWL